MENNWGEGERGGLLEYEDEGINTMSDVIHTLDVLRLHVIQ